MPIETTTFERAIHLLLFVAGGLAFAVAALALLERAMGGERRSIRGSHVVGSTAAFIAIALTEVAFHLMH